MIEAVEPFVELTDFITHLLTMQDTIHSCLFMAVASLAILHYEVAIPLSMLSLVAAI